MEIKEHVTKQLLGQIEIKKKNQKIHREDDSSMIVW